MANGVLYTVTSLGMLAAIDPATGDDHLAVRPGELEGRAARRTWASSHRGLAYWTDGKIERMITGTHDAYLISIDAKTGKPDPTSATTAAST